MKPLHAILGLALLVVVAIASPAQQQSSTAPLDSLREADSSPILLEGAEVVTAPGQPPRPLSILIRGTTIVEVGESIRIPAGTERRDLTGKQIYAGLIDAMREMDVPLDSAKTPASYWNRNVTPQLEAVAIVKQSDPLTAKYRSQGITTQLLAPKDGIVKGTSCAVLLLDANHPQRLLKHDLFQHLTLTVPRSGSRAAYPNSPMGATALVRQSLYDALWYRDANHAFENQPGLTRPERSAELEALVKAISHGAWVIDAANERMALRAVAVAQEFSLDAILRGSGREYRALDELRLAKTSILLPVNFPEPPNYKTAAAIHEASLVDWMHWHLAPENPNRLAQAGIEFCLTSDGLDDPAQFLKQVRIAVKRGLAADVALAALTTTPAKRLGIDHLVGRIQPGQLANLVVSDGDLFAESTKVFETWIAGERFAIEKEENEPPTGLAGKWSLALPTAKKAIPAILVLEQNGVSLSGRIELPTESKEKPKDDSEASEDEVTEDKPSDGEASDDASDKEVKPVTVKLENIVRQRERFSASVDVGPLSDALAPGVSLLSVLMIPPAGQSSDSLTLLASITTPDGIKRPLQLRRVKEAIPSETESDNKAAEPNSVPDNEKPSISQDAEPIASDANGSIQINYPLGPFGLIETPTQHESVLFRGATVWTCGPAGTLEQADVLVRAGEIVDVGADITIPPGTVVIDATGKHITPGIIDCHSHIATDGGINESGQAVTAEVRIGDFIDNSDISIYRQLAGGVTTVNILHGSANPIGGQNQVLKLRWGGTMDQMKFGGAPAGIKFALGENVKRNPNRYPNTRMGVEQILRDQFLAARQYEADMADWNAGRRDRLPPRRDLQLDALVEIQQGKRWVHCHSYRQDEIIATLDVLEEFNIQIGTLQHILEGYKVADRMAKHGAMASTFSDWWAYKFEVFDAIPFNGVLMHDAGVIVSYNSDDAEMARHLNTEAAKATKYGGVPEIEALKFVTLNPAKQLRIDDRVGSIEAGKDADLVIWSGRPLSTTTRCEATWIDGREYFSLKQDQELRERDQAWRAKLIQLASDKSSGKESPKPAPAKQDVPKELPEEERWVRFDIYCNASQTPIIKPADSKVKP